MMKAFEEAMTELAGHLPWQARSLVIPAASGLLLPTSLDGRDLPSSFLAAVGRHDFSGRSLGPVNFFHTPGQSYARFLREANESETNPFLGTLKEGNLFQVAAIETDMVCVGGTGSSIGEGAVGFVDVSTSAVFQGTRRCNAFGQFLGIVANLLLNRATEQAHLNAQLYRENKLTDSAVSFFHAMIA